MVNIGGSVINVMIRNIVLCDESGIKHYLTAINKKVSVLIVPQQRLSVNLWSHSVIDWNAARWFYDHHTRQLWQYQDTEIFKKNIPKNEHNFPKKSFYFHDWSEAAFYMRKENELEKLLQLFKPDFEVSSPVLLAVYL